MSDSKKRKFEQRLQQSRLKKRLIEKVLANNKTRSSPVNLNFLAEGWLEIESDPGTFSLLLEDIGCHGAQVDEIYDLEQKFDGPVLGFIFLFKWLHNQSNERSRSQKINSVYTTQNPDESNQNGLEKQWSYVTDDEIVSEMFFAKQTISNSCATHALISILLNCDYENLNLGPALSRLKEHTYKSDPENKGFAIGNLPELAVAHNSHASFSSLYNRDTSHHSGNMTYMVSGNQRTNMQQHRKHDSYHFVSYIPINGRLYELDGLKDYPIDHGPPELNEDWTEKFRRVIKQRIQENKTLSNEIRYNLMAVVPDKRQLLRSQLKKLRLNNRLIEEKIDSLSSPGDLFGLTKSKSIEIPKPPYSPLSNATDTASEVGSTCNSADRMSECDDESDRFFLIKFDRSLNNELVNDNQDSAHESNRGKSSIIDLSNSNASPLDLTKTKSSDSSAEHDKLNDGCSNSAKDISSPKVISNPMVGRPPIVQTFLINAEHKVEDSRFINKTQAHNSNLKYNLSGEPPFDFNVLDTMQHIHSGKSTVKELRNVALRLGDDLKKTEALLKEEDDKRIKFKIDNSRRTHNYEPFIVTFLSMLAKQGKLADLIEKDLGWTTENTPTTSIVAYEPIKPLKTKSPPHQISTLNQLVPKKKGQVGRPPKIRIQPESNGSSEPKPTSSPSKYKYVKTGRPVGRPRKQPIPVPDPGNCLPISGPMTGRKQTDLK